MWITPKTDWQSTDRVTPEDMNRITGNINHIYPAGNLRTGYTNDDFVTAAEWAAILNALKVLALSFRYIISIPGSHMISETFNDVESITQELKTRKELVIRNRDAMRYSGDGLYAGENYVRGL